MSASVGAVRLTLRVAATAAQREAAVAEWLAGASGDATARAVLAEGALVERRGPRGVPIVGLAAGCVCCVGLVPLRVALVRTLRRYRPRELLLLVVDEAHLPRLRALAAGGELGIALDLDVAA